MSETVGYVARIREGMVALVGRQGYEATSVEQICVEAGVSRRTSAATSTAGGRRRAPPFTRGAAEGLTGAVYESAIASIKAREGLAESQQRVKSVMHVIVLTYLGPEAAAEELAIPASGELSSEP